MRAHPGRGGALSASGRGARALWAAAAVGLAAASAGCASEPDPALLPDSLLRAELGLGDADRVHRVLIAGGRVETLAPDSVEVADGAWVEFVTQDWWVHEVRFDAERLAPEARAFLEQTDQVASPPLISRDQRFVVSFAGAPEARYPYVVEGNGASARGVVVVRSDR